MKPDEKVTRWLNEVGYDRFMAALNAQFRQFEETLVALNRLEPSDAASVFNPLFFKLCKLVVDEADKRLKSSKGGAKSGKAKADARWRTDARKAAQDYVDDRAKAERKPPRRVDVIKAIRREFKRKGKGKGKGKEEALPRDRAIGNLVDDMQREGQIKLEAK
jgi:hypothetical protein